MSKALFKDVFRSIKKTFSRFVSIIAIVALGIAMFAGIKAASPDMLDTADEYFADSNFMDIHVLSTIGLTDMDIYQIGKISGVEAVMPSRFADGLLEINGKGLVDIDGSAFSCRAISLDLDLAKAAANNTDDAAYINRLSLLDGKLPVKPGECLVDDSALSTPEELVIGGKIALKGDNENLANKLNVTEFTIVGIIRTPLYLSFERGNTLIGSGKLGTFIYVPDEAFNMSYYTNVYIKVAGAGEYRAYSEEYTSHVAQVIKKIEAISKGRVFARAVSLSLEYEPKAEEGKKELAQKELEINQRLEEGRKQVEQIKYFAENGAAELAAKKAEYENSLSAAQKELYLGKTEYNEAFAQYTAKLAEYNAAKAKADENPNAREEYNAAVEQLKAADEQIKSAEKQINFLDNVITTTEGALNATNSDAFRQLIARLEEAGMDTTIIELLASGTAAGITDEMKAYLIPKLEEYKLDLAQSKTELAAAKAEYAVKKAELDAAGEDIAKLDLLDEAYAQLKEAEQKLKSGSNDISVGELTLNMKQMQLKFELSQAEANLALAKAKAGTIDEEFAKKKADAELQLQNARYDIAAAENMLASLDKAQWYVQGREDLPGNKGYLQAAENMEAFAMVFPVFFFLIAAIVSLTTMARMVEEERIQLGTLKALGYGSGAIAAKYLIYALLASVIGSIIGLCLGFTLFPKAIFAAYSIMFELPPVLLSFRMKYAAAGILLAVLSTALAAFIACRSELIISPAQLMRPKAPKPGKRVFLEKIDFIWSRLSFTSKVTVRNLFRNKRRFVMTLVGIAGCAALLLTGLGIGDSVSAIVGNQYGEDGISLYDVQIVLRDEQDISKPESKTIKDIKADGRLKQTMLSCLTVLNGGSERAEGVLMETNIFVPQSNSMLSEFVRLNNRSTGEELKLGDDGVIITEKFAKNTKTKTGDEIFIKLSDNSTVKATVSGIVENYTFHYIYMSKSLYQKTFGEAPQFNFVTAKLADNIKAMNTDERNSEKSKLASDLMKTDGVNAVVYTTQIIDGFGNIIQSLNMIVLIFILAAGALAFIVLYNLSNININERVRELATIKVLGFYDKEVSSYIYRENMILTVLGVALGILLGLPIHSFVVQVAEVNVVMFGRSIDASSYILAALITIAFAALVNFIMHKKLKKISMVESLKSVE